MGLPVFEQETTVNFYRDSDICTVYTSDSTVMTKLDKLVKNPKAPHWKLKGEHRLQSRDLDGTINSGEIVGKTYETHKRLISFRADISTRELTEEQKEAAAERMKEWQERKRQEKSDSSPLE